MISTDISSQDITDIAEEAYIFAFPMLMGYRAFFGMALAKDTPSYKGPMNTLSSDSKTLDHTFRDVISPNADTPYTFAPSDLRAEPLVLSVPEVTDRYYVMQMEDLFGTNPHFVGTRATGTGAGSYLLAGPGWDGETPEGIDAVLRFETDIIFIIGRTQSLGAGDEAALIAVQEGYDLKPLSALTGEPAQPTPPTRSPVWDDEASRDERFIGYVNFLLDFCQPTHPSEIELMERFAKIGIAPRAPFDPDSIDAPAKAALLAGIESARGKIAQKAGNLSETVDGWQGLSVFGDRDFYDGDYLLRAAAAMAGWGGNDAIEAYYPIARFDADGAPLNASDGASYTIDLQSEPPAKAFWSFTMYDTSYDGMAGYLVENPIDRYLINTNTEGLKTADDGSLTIHISHEEPEGDEGANWLPAPDGEFYIILRIYMPEESALDGSWMPPPIVKN